MDLLLLEEFVEGLSDIVTVNLLRPSASCKRYSVVRFEVIAEVGLELISNIFCRGLTALIVLSGIEEAAVFAAMNVGRAVRAFIGSRKLADDFDLTATIMTDHRTRLLLMGVFARDGVRDHYTFEV